MHRVRTLPEGHRGHSLQVHRAVAVRRSDAPLFRNVDKADERRHVRRRDQEPPLGLGGDVDAHFVEAELLSRAEAGENREHALAALGRSAADG